MTKKNSNNNNKNNDEDKKIATMIFLTSMRLSTAFILTDFFYSLFARYFDGIMCHLQLYLVLIDSRDFLPGDRDLY